MKGVKELYKERSDGAVKFHWISHDVKMNGKQYKVGISIYEDARGDKFYNLNTDAEKYLGDEKPFAAYPAMDSAGIKPALPNKGSQKVTDTISQIADNINIFLEVL